MSIRDVLLDSNLLVLLVVGETDRNLISRHRRLKKFRVDDYLRLVEFLEDVETVIVTPNTLTETSNLLPYGVQARRVELLRTLGRMIDHQFLEVVVASRDAVRRWEYETLGLTDAALLDLISADRRLLTVDIDLYRIAASIHPDSVVSFIEWVEQH